MERINLNGKIYVDLDGLNQLIREHKKDTADGTKPGFICDDPEKRTFAMLALNHLGAVINREELDKKAQKRLAEIRADRERLEHPEMLFGVEAIPTKPTPSDVREIQKRCGYSNIIAKVMKTTEGKKFCLYLGGYMIGYPQFTNDCEHAMLFRSRAFAQSKAKELGDGWHVINMATLEEDAAAAKKLLDAIFRDDEEEDATEDLGGRP